MDNLVQCSKKIKKNIKRIFPNFKRDLIAIALVLAVLLSSIGTLKTATITQELRLMDIVANTNNDSQIKQEFEVSDKNDNQITTKEIEYKTSQMCFIGDSRTVFMECAVITDAHFIAKSSMGLNWFNETASVEFEKIKDDIELCVVALGINDIDNVEAYIKRLNKFAEQYEDKVFIYANIGPVDENKYTGIPNTMLEEFNEKMLNGLSDRWQILDQYTYLMGKGFSSDDGLHYSMQDSAGIFAWMVESVRKQTIIVT